MWQPKLGVDMSRVPITTGAPDYIWMQILKLPLNNIDHQWLIVKHPWVSTQVSHSTIVTIVRKLFKTKCKNAFMIFACFHFCEFFFRFFIFSAADLIFWWTSTIFRFDENFVKFDTRFWLSSKLIKTLAFFNTFEAFIFKFYIRTIVNNIEFMTTDTRQCCRSRIISRFYKGESIGIRDARGFQN